MFVEGFLVVLTIFQFSVARSNKGLARHHGVGVPLRLSWGEEWGAKETLFLFVVGAAAASDTGGRTILEKRRMAREFNPTKGFPGEDI